jgi:hypothetical protein
VTHSQPGTTPAGGDQGSVAELHEVRLLRLPVAIHARAQEHGAELTREMYLMAQQLRHDTPSSSDAKPLPHWLTQLIEVLTSQFGGLTTEQDRQLDDAVERGVDEVDVVYRLPVAAAAASRQLGEMLDEADEFCRQGKHLLTLATPADLVRYRRWYLGEMIAQLDGGSPTPWPEYADPA